MSEKYVEYTDAKTIEKAISFLVGKINTTGHNPKPVILHSIRVGMKLLEHGYPARVVIAGILHDTIEDSDATKKEIADNFGKEVAVLVEAASYDGSIKDKVKQYEVAFEKCGKLGKEALIVVAADFITNIPYFSSANDSSLYNYLRDKLDYFISCSRETIGSEPLFKEMERETNSLLTQGK